MGDNDLMKDIFADEDVDKKNPLSGRNDGSWKILVVDDDEDIRSLTRLTLENFSFENKTLQLIEATSAAEGKKILREQPDIALVLLNMMMESTTAGLQLANFVRETLGNHFVRIILRTGYPGESPEREVLLSYDIDGYVTKTELTVDKLFSLVVSALRAYKTIMEVEGYRRDLERKVKERTHELTTSEEKYKTLYDNVPLSYQSLDGDGCFIEVNPSWLRTLGFERKEVIGKWFGDFLHPDWKPHFEKYFSVFKEPGYIKDVELKIRHKDGHYLDVSFEGYIEYGPDGTVKQAYCVFQVITKRKRIENALRKSRKLWHRTFNSISDFITLQDTELCIIKANQAACTTLDLPHDAIVGQHCYEIFYNLQEACSDCPMLETGKPYEPYGREIFHEKLGKTFLLSAAPVFDDQGKIEYIVHVAKDITFWKQAEERLLLSEKMNNIAGLTAGVAHEINTPLSGILQSIQIIQMELDPDSPKNREVAATCGIDLSSVQAYFKKRELDFFLDGIRSSAMNASIIIKRLLAFSRPSIGIISSHNLNKLIQEALILAKSDYDLRKKYDIINIKIIEEYTEDLPHVICMGVEIEQVILDLIKNGVQAMAETENTEHCLSLRTLHTGTAARIEVEDNGPGMDDETRKQIFDPFFTTKDVGVGTGLGLSAAYAIISKKHNGKIWVETKPGKGATFIIELPFNQES
ncbi:MAG: PAS domain S-box protein [Desulfocapsa sp.]|nr:PAS domain S-box protein [Desulfocapsa sp.]